MTTGDFFTGEGGLLPPSVGADMVNVGNTGHIPSGGGGGGAGGQSLSEIIAQMEQEANQRLELIQLSERQSRVREIELELIREIGGEVDETAMAQIQAAAQTVAAIESQVDAYEELRDMQESIADTVSSSFGDAIMSMVDGTKTASEAFRSMAREIISELFRIIVVEQMVQSIRGAIGGGGGGILGSIMAPASSVLTGFASGGYAMAGESYLVGERGPELFSPGRSGTITNNNLTASAQGSQQVEVRVFVDDNGNFDARVEQISQRNVARAAPGIVQRSVGAVVEQTKRGGAIKGALR
jgi:hypothetical protein